MSRLFFTLRLLLLAAVPLLAASCAADMNPSPAPAGYKYNGQQYNAPWTGPVKQMNYPNAAAAPSLATPVMRPDAPPMAAGPQPTPADLVSPMTPSGAPQVMPPAGPMPVYSPDQQSAIPPGVGTPGSMATMQRAAADLLTRTEHDFGRLRDAVYVRPPVSPDEAVFAQALTETMRQRHYKISTDVQKSAFVADYRISGAAPQPNVTLKINDQEGHTLQKESGDYAASPGMAANTAPVVRPAAVQAMAPQSPPVAMPLPQPASVTAAVPPSPSPLTIPPAMADSGAVPPPMPVSQIPPSPGSVTVSDGKTYVYDGRDTKAPGHTAYEQMQGTDHVVGYNYGETDR